MTLFLTTYIVKKFHATSIDAIRYALAFFLLQAVFVFIGTALADRIGRRPSAVLGALIEIASTALGATSTPCRSTWCSAPSPSPPWAGCGSR